MEAYGETGVEEAAEEGAEGGDDGKDVGILVVGGALPAASHFEAVAGEGEDEWEAVGGFGVGWEEVEEGLEVKGSVGGGNVLVGVHFGDVG